MRGGRIMAIKFNSKQGLVRLFRLYRNLLLILTAAMLLCIFLPQCADAADEFYFASALSEYAPGEEPALSAPLSLAGGGNRNIVDTDRGRSLQLSTGEKALSLINMDLKPYLNDFFGKFRIGFSVKDIGAEAWGHRQIIFIGTDENGGRIMHHAIVFSKVTHRIMIDGIEKTLYQQNVWYDVVMDFDASATELYADVTITTPYDSGFLAEGRVVFENMHSLSHIQFTSGVTSDPSHSVTMYDDFYISSRQDLRAISVSPADGEENVQINQTPSIAFNNRLNPAMVSTEHVMLSGGEAAECSVGLGADGKSVLLYPAAGVLSAGTNYTIELLGLEDIFGNQLSARYSFRTADAIAVTGVTFHHPDSPEPLKQLQPGTVEARAKVSLRNGGQSEAILFLALYWREGGVLKQLACSGTNRQNGMLTASVTVPETSGDYCLIAYIWDGTDSLTPLTKAARLY